MIAFFGVLEAAARWTLARGIVPARREVLRSPIRSFAQLLAHPELLIEYERVRDEKIFAVDDKTRTLRTIDPRIIRPMELSLDGPPAGYRLLFLGGSSVNGYFYDADQSFAARVGAALEKRPGLGGVTVVNGGVNAGNSDRCLGTLERIGPLLRPDVVVVYAGHNDFYPASVRFNPDLLNDFRSRFVRGLYRRSALLRLGAQTLVPMPDNVPVALCRTFEERFATAGPAQWDVWNRVRHLIETHYEANIKTLADRAHALGAKVLVLSVTSNLTYPPDVSVHGPDFDPKNEARFRETLAKAEAQFRDGPIHTLPALLESLLEMDPRYPRANYLMGTVLARTGHPDDAVLYLRRARDLSPAEVAPRAPTSLAAAAERGALAAGAAFLDTEETLLARPDREEEFINGRLFKDHLHFSAEGHRVMADLVIDRLDRLGWADGDRNDEAR